MNRRDQPPTSDSRPILLTHATSIPCKRLPHSCPPQSYAEPEICQHTIETREVRDPSRSCKQKQKKCISHTIEEVTWKEMSLKTRFLMLIWKISCSPISEMYSILAFFSYSKIAFRLQYPYPPMQCFPLASQIPEVIPGPVSSRLRQMQHIKGTKLMGHDQYHPNSTFSFLNLSNLSSRKCRQFPQASGSRICFPCAHLLRQ